jgi:tRNA modification GTPase
MIPNPDDCIVALATAAGPGARAIVRLSGRSARSVAASVFTAIPDERPAKRTLFHGVLCIPGAHSLLPADLYLSLGPRTYTGQDTAELHFVSCPALIDALIAALLNAGARAAQPGEFTLRAFLNGKKDLPRAEAVLAVTESGSADELEHALAQLAGGVTRPLDGLREDLLDLLADVEAGLDFTDDDIQFVAKKDILLRLAKGLAQLTIVSKQIESRSLSGRPFRVVLVGQPNAGKSSLLNALAGKPTAIVSPVPGTTRDYITHTVEWDRTSIELIDTAGRQPAENVIEEQAQTLGLQQVENADLLLWCIDMSTGGMEVPTSRDASFVVGTKSDLGKIEIDGIATSARTGAGIDQLKSALIERARAANRSSLAPSLSRCRHHVDACLKHLRSAHSIVLFDDPAELMALELRLALEQLGEMVGAVYTDELLDRIFSRFCIGK